MAAKPPLIFNIYRHEPELIRPATPTPHEFKFLSDLDDQDGLRVQLPLIQFYNYHPSMQSANPVYVIKQALAQTLVFYYPLAGRLRELPSNRKLLVECNGEGILFVEAFADFSVDDLSGSNGIRPPFPCLDQLLYDVPGSSGIVDSPLMLIQATRLKCGGIIIAFRYNHTISDAKGTLQFWLAVGEIARGASIPSVLPTWERHLLNARNPPRITCQHHEYVDLVDNEEQIPLIDKDHRSFFLGHAEIAALKTYVPPRLQPCSSFEIITASFWKCRTIALQPNPNEEMRLLCIVDARNKFNPPIPEGYYGNCIAYSAAVARAGNLCEKPIEYALELVRKAKANVTEEYMQSVADLMVIKGRPRYTMVKAFLVSGVGRRRFDEVDFGWGRAIYGGPAKGNVASFHIAHRNEKGKDGIVVTLCLPKLAMQRFMKELDSMLKNPPAGDQNESKPFSAM